MFYLLLSPVRVALAESINYGHWREAELTQIITSKNALKTSGAQIVEISSHFVDTPYAANTLIGGPQTTEQLVINLERFDCFTLLDTIEAFRRTTDLKTLPEQLRHVRYSGGTVTYVNRRHFFSDWVTADADVYDVTAAVGHGAALTVEKQLNRRNGGSLWLPGVAIKARKITYIPTEQIDQRILAGLLPGDYVGIYSSQAGLDVSHTGLIIINEGRVMIRHASSRNDTGRVVDEELLDYLHNKPGLVVYRVVP